MTQYPGRFTVIYVLLALALVGSGLAAYAITQIQSTKHAVSQVKAELGPTNLKGLVLEAEQNVSNQAHAGGITVLSMYVYKTSQPDERTVKIYLRVKTAEIGSIDLEVDSSKGVYQIVGVSQVA